MRRSAMKERDLATSTTTACKYLMYRDWSGFELFFIEILKCTSLPGLLQIGHRFETFLMTLFREVQKRSILQDYPLAAELAGIETRSWKPERPPPFPSVRTQGRAEFC